ncbi:hypothetical protein [Streptomyces sp. S1D4-20]|uniref:hypothetical protein n=1 Tax=Streptomyces sp. S1D4-20 TaxID=2594462 RepID=UPI0011642770|nr:hypothetical protein [Streptomyces sp. S1D4-20]QDN54074.1 hypothetical protein FNV67_00395 [Streptomyces sp. S1D4-20]
MSVVLPVVTAAVPVPLWDVVIGREALGPLPDGVCPVDVRVARADMVRGGDLVVGYFDELPGRRWMPTACVGEVCFRALPALHPRYRDVFALDGLLFQWMGHDLALIVPAGLAPVTYAAGDRVERVAERRPHHEALLRRFEQRGTVTGAVDGVVTVRFDGEVLPVALPTTAVRHIDADSAQSNRDMYGFAHGDTVTMPYRPAVRGTVVDLWRDVDEVKTAYVVWQSEPPQDVRVRDLRPAA